MSQAESSINSHPKINAKLEGYRTEEKKATGLGSWHHALSRCGVFFPVSYYSWSSAWMSQERERAPKRGMKRDGGKRWWKGGEVETDRQTRENRGVGTDGQPPLDYWAG